ncbi:MAG TPA: efflux RND transporter periplasmic adaptor subunit [Nitrospiraceae bacterium]|nr:efflux RND transporter periplasmic adaptor subunit [Nitrospiraceae bacterium]
MTRMYRTLGLPLLAAICVFGCGKHEEPGASNAATPAIHGDSHESAAQQSRIETAVVAAKQDKPKLTLAGKVAYGEDRYSKISSPVQGRVLEVRARLGDRVKTGDILLVIDSPDIAQAYSEFIKEESDLTYAIRAYELAKDLYETKALPLKDLKQSENDLVKAKAEFRRAKERLLSLRVPAAELDKPMDKQMITSRFAMRSSLTGTVVERTVTPGQSVGGDPSQVLFTVADLDTLQVVADIYERDLDLIHAGLTATVTVEAYPDADFAAAIAAIGDVVDPNTRTIKVRAWVDNASHKLKPEMFARLHIDIGEGKEFISIPKEAVLEIDGKEFVYIAQTNGTYMKQEVKVGSASDDHLRILRGLKLGDRVVTKGAILLKGNESKG